MKKTKFYRKIFFFQTRLPVPATRPQSSINQRKEFVEQNESKNEKKMKTVAGTSYRRGRLSTVDLLIKIACFVT
jgi:hypothetical protein